MSMSTFAAEINLESVRYKYFFSWLLESLVQFYRQNKGRGALYVTEAGVLHYFGMQNQYDCPSAGLVQTMLQDLCAQGILIRQGDSYEVNWEILMKLHPQLFECENC